MLPKTPHDPTRLSQATKTKSNTWKQLGEEFGVNPHSLKYRVNQKGETIEQAVIELLYTYERRQIAAECLAAGLTYQQVVYRVYRRCESLEEALRSRRVGGPLADRATPAQLEAIEACKKAGLSRYQIYRRIFKNKESKEEALIPRGRGEPSHRKYRRRP